MALEGAWPLTSRRDRHAAATADSLIGLSLFIQVALRSCGWLWPTNDNSSDHNSRGHCYWALETGQWGDEPEVLQLLRSQGRDSDPGPRGDTRVTGRVEDIVGRRDACTISTRKGGAVGTVPWRLLGGPMPQCPYRDVECHPSSAMDQDALSCTEHVTTGISALLRNTNQTQVLRGRFHGSVP